MDCRFGHCKPNWHDCKKARLGTVTSNWERFMPQAMRIRSQRIWSVVLLNPIWKLQVDIAVAEELQPPILPISETLVTDINN
jgi:hypothetical protein